MPWHRAPLAVLSVSLTMAATAVTAVSAAATPRDPAGPVVPGRPVVLLDGARLLPATAGAGRAGVILPPADRGRLGRQGRTTAVTSFTIGGRDYVVPAAAVPYLGRGLAASLFDVSALRRVERGGRLPVAISFHGALPALPGIRITRTGHGTASGYLTSSSAARFGQALTRQAIADRARASYSTDRMFAGHVSIRLAGTAAAPMLATQAGGTRHKLTITASDLAGKPDTGDMVLVSNVANSNLFAAEGDFQAGAATFSVPAGRYWAVGTFIDTSGSRLTENRVTVLPQFTVAGTTTVHLAERAATSQVTMATPRKATAEDSDFEVRRPSRSGPVQFYAFSDVGLSLWVSPTSQRPSVGRLQTFTAQQLVSPASVPGTPYEYTLAYQGPAGIVPGQHHLVRPAGLATVDARYFQDVSTTGAKVRYGMFPAQLNDLQFEATNSFTMPRHQTEYLTGNPAISYFSQILQCYPSSPCPGGQNDAVRSYHAGERAAENWNAYPLHPGVNVNLLGPANPDPTVPSAARSGNTLAIDVSPFSDNQPGHTAAGFATATHQTATYQLEQNGRRVAAGTAPGDTTDVAVRAALRPGRAAVRFALTASRTGSGYPLSDRTSTVWTWRSAARPAASLPRGWACRAGAVGAASRRCDVQPMLTLGYSVAHLALDGSARPGPQTLTITAGHLQLAHAAPITGARAWVSYDGGRTWRVARVAPAAGPGQFTARFTAPAGSLVTLRVRATDAAGGSIAETIYRSYRTVSAGARP